MEAAEDAAKAIELDGTFAKAYLRKGYVFPWSLLVSVYVVLPTPTSIPFVLLQDCIVSFGGV